MCINEFGKAVYMIRNNRDEQAKDMAKRINITPSSLSTACRKNNRMTTSRLDQYYNSIIAEYDLTPTESEYLRESYLATKREIEYRKANNIVLEGRY